MVQKLGSLATKRDVSTRANVMDTSPKTAYYYHFAINTIIALFTSIEKVGGGGGRGGGGKMV